MCFVALIITGLFVVGKVPVSLLPDVDVPQIVIRVNYPNTAADVLEQNIIRPVRENLANVGHLQNIESQSSNHTGIIYLTFDYSTRMDLAYIAVNEKIDQLTNSLPRDMPRPQVTRINISDVPIIRIQVIPRPGTNFIEASELTEKTLKKRIEQIEGVSLVDVNGMQQLAIDITPDKESLQALGLNEDDIMNAIKSANEELGALSIEDGHYRFFLKLKNSLRSGSQLSELPIRLKDGSVIPISRVAAVKYTVDKPTGYHLLNGHEGMVITVEKQADSKMNELVPRIRSAVEEFKADYPQIEFSFTRDQSFLLDAGISNLYQDIIIGGILTIALLFMFLGNWASPTLMSISIPVSLILTFIFFYLFHVSFNIISLSGLALGIGMLIDNSIIVIDNITRQRSQGLSMMESSVKGTNEVIAPVVSQVLTTVAVYAPLILLNGMAGSLITDQSIALTISLGVSLLAAFVLAPLLYKIMLKRNPDSPKEDTIFYRWIARGYHRMIHHILHHKLTYFLITLAIMPIGVLLAFKMPVSALPKIEKKESLILIDWQAPIDAQENMRRIKELQAVIQPLCLSTEAEVGIQQFLQQNENNTIQNTLLYYECSDESGKWKTDKAVRDNIHHAFPEAYIKIIDAPNAFTQLFTSATPYIEARFRPLHSENTSDVGYNGFNKMIGDIDQPFETGLGMITQKNIDLTLDYDKMALYGVSRTEIERLLQQLFGNYIISGLKTGGDEKPLRLKTPGSQNEDKFNSIVTSDKGQVYPLRTFISTSYAEQPKFITGDRFGVYRSLIFGPEIKDVEALQRKIIRLAAINNYSVEFTGRFFEDKEQIKKLWLIFVIVLFLLYIILAIQYEDLILPLVVMLTIPLGISGAMFLLWITGGTLDAMASIGFIVVLGLIVDDPTLKVEVLNRLDKEYKAKGYERDNSLLEKMIHEAGDICLKPLLMVSLTTSIAMVPVLFFGGIGNDLQKPLAYVIIGGLTIGTFFTTWFIPLAFWYISKWKNRLKHRINKDI
jgi:multidrug efflux pump subunit AcrB